MARYQEIFVPGGFPKFTYNPRPSLKLEEKVAEAAQNLCKLVTVTGQTKSGKTVLVRTVYSRENAVWIDGGVVSEEEEFWQVVVDQLSLFQETSEDSSHTTTAGFDAEAKAGANFVVVKGEGKLGAKFEKGRERASGKSRSLSSRVVALGGLAQAKLPLVIDDFHYLPKELQGSIIRALKPLIFDGLPVVIIAIPHRRYDAVKVEKEMTGRIFPVDIPSWSSTELRFISDTGFSLLNASLPLQYGNRLVDQALGSPHLMQDFCRSICKKTGIQDSLVHKSVPLRPEDVEDVFRDVAETIGRPIFEKLARGPRQRSDRLPRELKDGKTVDIYQLVLHGLAHMRPGLVSIEYEELRSAIRDVSAGEIPQLHEISRVLKHMSTIAATDQSSTPVIDFEEAEQKLHITDPFFAFYLRWGTLAA